MPAPEQIRILNEAVRALEDAETAYIAALADYRNSVDHDSQAVDRALVVREIAQLAVETAEIAAKC